MSTNRSYGDTVSAIVGPAVLATAVMNLHNWTYLQTANVLFGYYVSEKLEVPYQSFEPRAESEHLGLPHVSARAVSDWMLLSCQQ